MSDVPSGDYQVFISHSTLDKGTARDFCTNLEKAGYRVWIAPRDIPAGSKFEEGIMNGICASPVFLLICTHNLDASTFVLDEVNAAKRRNKTIIPLMMEKDLSFPPAMELLLSRYQWLEFWDMDMSQCMPELVSALRGYIEPGRKCQTHTRAFKRTAERGTGPSIQSAETEQDPNGAGSLLKSAREGDAWAQYTVARMYGSGYNLLESYTEAVRWYRSASAQGHLMARSVLHSLVPSEKDVSDAELRVWMEENADKFREKADEGNAIAQCDMGWMYQYGTGEPQSYREAVNWYAKSAGQGYARAQNILGVIYVNGDGVEQSFETAVGWFRKAADQNYARAQYHLGLLCDEGKGVEKDPSAAADYYKRAADQGHPMAQNNLAWKYQNGDGVEQSDVTALNWYTESAQNGYAIAQYNLGMMYINGSGTDESYAKATEWFEKAADQGHAGAMYNLAVILEGGLDTEADIGRAVELYRKAAELGDEDAEAAYRELTSQ